MQNTDDELRNYVIEIYIMLLTNITLMNIIKIKALKKYRRLSLSRIKVRH